MAKAKKTQIIKGILSKMGFSVEVSEVKEDDNIIINITTEESSLLIGRAGENLRALQHLASLMVYKALNNPSEKFILDINHYRQKQKEKLQELAQRIAEKVSKFGQAEVLRPMTAYERRIIHLELDQHPTVQTASIGEEPNRRIVVRKQN